MILAINGGLITTSAVPVVPILVPITLEALSRLLDAPETFVPPLPSFPPKQVAPEVVVVFFLNNHDEITINRLCFENLGLESVNQDC
jgi:hypothetical protein